MAISYKSKILASDLEDRVVKVTVDPITKKVEYTNLNFFTGKAENGEEVVSQPVGGIIYAIDSTATGTYIFYDAYGTQVSAPSVGTDCTGWSYRISGTHNKDKFYVRQVINRLNYDDQGGYVKWASIGEDLSGYSSQIEVLSEANTLLGKGRSNTNFIMTVKVNDPVYFFTRSIWQLCKDANSLSLDGCSDWYIPSISELIAIRNAFSSKDAFSNWARNTSNPSAVCWSSSAHLSFNNSWCWIAPDGNDEADYDGRRNEIDFYCSCLSRSF